MSFRHAPHPRRRWWRGYPTTVHPPESCPARAHKRLKTSHQTEIEDTLLIDRFAEYLDTNRISLKQNEDFDVIKYWQDRYESQPDLARFALDVLTVPPMSDECERLFSSCKILLEDRSSRLMMDIIEANECLRHSYAAPRKGTFDDEEAGEWKGSLSLRGC